MDNVTDHFEKANNLNHYFKSVFMTEDNITRSISISIVTTVSDHGTKSTQHFIQLQLIKISWIRFYSTTHTESHSN